LSGIFGIFNRGGAPVETDALHRMRGEMAGWGCEGGGTVSAGPAGLGLAVSFNTPEARFECPPSLGADTGIAVAAAARLDNRDELASGLGLRGDLSRLADGELIRLAFLRWGESCPGKIAGDWSFAAWDSSARRLFLARDQSGNTALYYYSSPRVFAFSSSRRALLALGLSPVEMDELYLAQLLVCWTAYHGDRTIHNPIRRLPPAHALAVTETRMDVRRYWRLEDVPELRLAHRTDYLAGFREVFDRAVRACLRSEGPVASTLSGGLDSGSVALTAAGFLEERGHRLAAFTSIPRYGTGTHGDTNARFTDESGYARATAQAAGGCIDLNTFDSAELSPLRAIRRALEITTEPMHAAGNLFWILELCRVAATRGYRTLLTGQHGNTSISWRGEILCQPFPVQLRRLGWRGCLRQNVEARLPTIAARALHARRRARHWSRYSAVHPRFARRIGLLERLRHAPDAYPRRGPRCVRTGILLPGESFDGAVHAELGAAAGLEIRDPTADARVQSFCFSVPETVFIDPATGLDRWLIREAMKGRLPDVVRLNRRTGLQAGDLVARLRHFPGDMEGALSEISSGPGADYVDVSRMRDVWDQIGRSTDAEDTPELFRLAVSVLTRGIMAGLFVNRFSAW
jgi:asparagine synthase (glutamine-hydrolysing)